MRFIAFFYIFIFMVAGCSSLSDFFVQRSDVWHRSFPQFTSYSIRDRLSFEEASTRFSFFEDIPEFAALSQSAYRNIDPPYATKRTLAEFCASRRDTALNEEDRVNIVYRPENWKPVEELTSIAVAKGRHESMGLVLEVFFSNRHQGKSVLLFVFRGTDFEQSLDWKSNLRYFLPERKRANDQYQETRRIVPAVIEEFSSKQRTFLTRYGTPEEIFVTGHSLGGGLALMAAFSTPGISRAYVFNASPVTGLVDVDAEDIKENLKGLKVFFINEHNDALQYLREAKHWFVPFPDQLSSQEIRFNLTKGTTITRQHSLEFFYCNLKDQLNQRT